MNVFFSAKFISKHFNGCFARCGPKRNGQLFLRDNDPSETGNAALNAIERVEAKCHRIPSKSPDPSLIELVFNVLKGMLEDEAISKEITSECLDDFKARLFNAMDNLSINVINHTI